MKLKKMNLFINIQLLRSQLKPQNKNKSWVMESSFYKDGNVNECRLIN